MAEAQPNELWYPVLGPEDRAVCDTEMTDNTMEGNDEAVCCFGLTEENYYRLASKKEGSFSLEERDLSTKDMEEVLLNINEAKQLFMSDSRVNLMEEEWERLMELLRKCFIRGEADDLMMYYIEDNEERFFMLSHGVSYVHCPAANSNPSGFFLRRTAKTKSITNPGVVEKKSKIVPGNLEIQFKSFSQFKKSFKKHPEVFGHVLPCLVALSHEEEQYIDYEKNEHNLLPRKVPELENDPRFRPTISCNSKVEDNLYHACLGGHRSDFRLMYRRMRFRKGKETKIMCMIYIIGTHAEIFKGGNVKATGSQPQTWAQHRPIEDECTDICKVFHVKES